MKRAFFFLMASIGVCVALVVALVLVTRGDYLVAPLVTEDANLPSAEVAGVRLHFRRIEGPPEAPNIVVLHGGPGGDFRSLMALEALSDSHSVVFYDQRGAGLSERVSGDDLNLDGHLFELNAIIARSAKGQPVVLIGHSWGAMLATAYLGMNPEQVQSAILIEPGYLDGAGKGSWTEEAQKYMSGGTYWKEAVLSGFRAQHVIGPDANAADDFLIGHMVGVFADHPDNPYHCGGGYSAPSWRFGAASSRRWEQATVSEVDQIARGTAFDGPVLLLAGDCNDWIGPSLQAKHMERFTDAELVGIPNAGHDVVWDNPDATLAAIRAFLD